jgi:aminopeptidase YwaD
MERLNELAKEHLSYLCNTIGNRHVGGEGNLAASDYFKEQLIKNKWHVESQQFDAFDWESEVAVVEMNNRRVKAFSSPYSEPCNIEAEVARVSTLEELQKTNARHKILIVNGKLTTEQLMPKNFVFYNPDHHKRIISLFEQCGAVALIFIVSKRRFYEGGEYPFPIIEDGDFKIPSVYLSEETGEKLLTNLSSRVKVISNTKKRPSVGYNIIGRKGEQSANKIVITAHIDAKKGSPGAIDNGTGVVTMTLLSEMLKDYHAAPQLELVALNGEDYYSVPGQMTYIEGKHGSFSDIALNINIDGAGMNKGKTSFALMGLTNIQSSNVKTVFNTFPGLTEGKPWVQGDHSIFLQYGVPAIAISSEWLLDNLQTQQITHTKNDHVSIVDISRVTELAEAISALLISL